MTTFRIARTSALAAVVASLTLLAGCGGGGSSSPAPAQTGTVRVNVVWPERTATREVAKAAESVKATLTLAGSGGTVALTLNRTAPGAATADFAQPIPVGTHSLRLQAYAAANATGQLVGDGSTSVVVTSGQVTSVGVNSNVTATVTEVVLSAASSTVIFNGQTQLTPEFRDADDNVLMPTNSAVTYSATGGSVSGAGVFTAGTTAGDVTITATHTASGSTGTATVQVVDNVIYSASFSSQAAGFQPGPEWSRRVRAWVPVPGDPAFITDPALVDTARGILGLFGNETVTLNLSGLAPHSRVRLEFDAVLARFWEGDRDGGYRLRASLGGGGGDFLNATFNNYPLADTTGQTQSFPVAGSVPGTGSALFKEQGYVAGFPGSLQVDAKYVFNAGTPGYTAEFSHTDSNLVINFQATLPNQDTLAGLDAASNEAWGLERVRVTLLP